MDLDNQEEIEFKPDHETGDPQADEQEGGGAARAKRYVMQKPKALWLTSYADFMTILMIFFLSLYGYSFMAKSAMAKERKASYNEFIEAVQNLQYKLGDQLKVEHKANKVILKLGGKVLFASNSATLSEQSRGTLEELSNSIKLIEGDVIIEGHTDNVPIVSGPFKSNWELSAARAFSVIKALSENGVEEKRLAAWGFGENRPLEPNDTAERRAQNRRIEVILLRKKSDSV